MSNDTLAQFLKPGRVERLSTDGVPVVQIRGTASTLEFTPHGAHVTGWHPTGGRPVLFMSGRSHFAEGKPIRGGVPLVFPWFGPSSSDPTAPAHGFARILPWRIERAEVDSAGTAHAVLCLDDDAATRALWPHAFGLRLEIEASDRLTLRLVLHNPSDAPVTIEAALHTYFAVSDAREAKVHGLEHTEYLDKTDALRRKRQGAEPISFTAETDRMYLNTDATCVLEDRGWGRKIRIAKRGSGTTVVWNPWIAKAKAMPDFGDDEWPAMVCVETAAANENRLTLAARSTHTLEATYSIESV